MLVCDQYLYKSLAIHRHVHGQCRLCTITVTESALLIFLQSARLKNCWHGWVFEPTTLDLSSQSGAFDLPSMAKMYVSAKRL